MSEVTDTRDGIPRVINEMGTPINMKENRLSQVPRGRKPKVTDRPEMGCQVIQVVDVIENSQMCF